jgi:hypothetical protein
MVPHSGITCIRHGKVKVSALKLIDNLRKLTSISVSGQRVTFLKWFAYLLFERKDDFSPILAEV